MYISIIENIHIQIHANYITCDKPSSGERFASHDDIFNCRGSKRSGRLYFCSGPYLILPTIEWQIQQLCQHDFIFRISRYRACACTHNLMTCANINIYLALICFRIRLIS